MASPELTGILNVNKAPGWTSHDVVARVRRLAGQRRVGHAGTLDPAAEGVLPVLLGRATRLAAYIQGGPKNYVATMLLGAATDTDDAEGQVVSEAPVPPLSSALLERTLAAFVGDIVQRPPSYSALKVAGRRAYDLARRGEDVDLAPRRVTIQSLRLLDWTPTELRLDVTCSTGTYIRSLAREMAVALGTVGHLRALVRTAVGPFRIQEACTLDDIAEHGVQAALLSARCALPDAPCLTVDSDAAQRLAHGLTLSCAGLRAEPVWVYDADRLVCLAVADGERLRPRLML